MCYCTIFDRNTDRLREKSAISSVVVEGVSIPFVDLRIYLFGDEEAKALLFSHENYAKGESIVVDGGLVDTKNARSVAETVTGVAQRLTDRLGEIFFIVEETQGT